MADATRYEIQEWDDGQFSGRDEPGWNVLAVRDTPEEAEAARQEALLVARGLLQVVPVERWRAP